jgi:hypothetical protein
VSGPPQGARSPLRVATLAGVFAGTLATAVQMLLWWLEGTPVVATLLRDARLTAAIVMGEAAFAPAPAWRWDVLLAATLLHFALSIACAALALPFARRLRTAPALAAGALYGLAIYAINLHGFTVLFPWFAAARGGVTLLTHVAFGLALVAACRALTRARRPPAGGG